MKKNLLYTLYFSLIIALSSCYKDKGNYDLIDLNEVAIDTSNLNIKPSYSLDRFDTLTIAPEIIYNGEIVKNIDTFKDKIEITWTIYQATTGIAVHSLDTLSNDLILKKPINKPSGLWVVKMSVKDLQYQTETFTKFQVNVNEIIADGWMVLYEKDGLTDVGLIVDERVKVGVVKNKLFTDLIKDHNPTPLYGKPVALLHPTSTLTKGKDVIVMTDKQLLGLSRESFEVSYKMNDFFWALPSTINFQAFSTNFTASKEFMINNNRIHTLSMTTIGFDRKNTKYSPPIGNDNYEIAAWQPKKYLSSLDGVFYDAKGKKFMKLTANSTQLINFSSTPAGAFDLNNVGLDLINYDWGYLSASPATHNEYLLMRNSTNTYLIVANFNVGVEAQIPVNKINLTNSPDINNTVSMAVAYAGQYLLYASPNSVYLNKFNTAQNAEVLWKCPDGEVITDIQLQKFYYNAFHLANILPNANKYVYFATWNESTKNGKIYSYEINPTNGDINLSTERVYEGFGKIKEMTYKWGL